jgi:hypothetical protein
MQWIHKPLYRGRHEAFKESQFHFILSDDFSPQQRLLGVCPRSHFHSFNMFQNCCAKQQTHATFRILILIAQFCKRLQVRARSRKGVKKSLEAIDSSIWGRVKQIAIQAKHGGRESVVRLNGAELGEALQALVKRQQSLLPNRSLERLTRMQSLSHVWLS